MVSLRGNNINPSEKDIFDNEDVPPQKDVMYDPFFSGIFHAFG